MFPPLYNRILEVLCSEIGRDTGYPDSGSSWLCFLCVDFSTNPFTGFYVFLYDINVILKQIYIFN
jgi:hypothetical protein